MLTNTVAVITGASSGIGAALAKLLAAEGATVVLAARRKDKLDELTHRITHAGGKAFAVKCDVTVSKGAEELIHHTVRKHGRIDILVNNAGRGNFASIEDTTDEMIERIFAVNAFALWYTTRPTLPYMKQQGTGHIINIASMAGKFGFPFNSAYVAAKHACIGLTRALRLELAGTGINATVVCPSGAETEWAVRTEGGPMLPLFVEAAPIAKEIAQERGITLPEIEGVLPPDVIAKKILECIYHPVAELYTHRGAREFALLAAQHLEEAERRYLPLALAERQVYKRMKGPTPSVTDPTHEE
jgi:NAD(P)-dependent dehydrogenase (short-subunit alcohol dehydrogenase family)